MKVRDRVAKFPKEVACHGFTNNWMWVPPGDACDLLVEHGNTAAWIDLSGCCPTPDPATFVCGYWMDHMFDDPKFWRKFDRFASEVIERNLLFGIEVVGANFPRICDPKFTNKWFREVMKHIVDLPKDRVFLDTVVEISPVGNAGANCLSKLLGWERIAKNMWGDEGGGMVRSGGYGGVLPPLGGSYYAQHPQCVAIPVLSGGMVVTDTNGPLINGELYAGTWPNTTVKPNRLKDYALRVLRSGSGFVDWDGRYSVADGIDIKAIKAVGRAAREAGIL